MRWSWKRPSLPKSYQYWWKENAWWITFIIWAVITLLLVVAFRRGMWLSWVGFRQKTVWDWLELLGVPLSLAILGYLLQQQQQRQAMALAQQQRDQAAEEEKEEILQTYFDRISVLLIDKDILALALHQNTFSARAPVDVERERVDAARDVVRARTLSILRRFQDDPLRKTSVIRFLIESEVISKLKIDLSGSSLSGADLSGAALSGVSLQNADLSGVNLSWANLREADLCGADLSSANLSHTNLSQALLAGASLKHADLNGAALVRTSFADADLSMANLGRVNLIIPKEYVNFHENHKVTIRFAGANLSGARLSGDLRKADFSRANLSKADLSGANLRGADCIWATLRGADLSQADLSEAKLREADFTGAVFSRTKLQKTDFTEVKLTGAKLTEEELREAYLCRTVLPSHINLSPNRDCQELRIDPADGCTIP